MARAIDSVSVSLWENEVCKSLCVSRCSQASRLPRGSLTFFPSHGSAKRGSLSDVFLRGACCWWRGGLEAQTGGRGRSKKEILRRMEVLEVLSAVSKWLDPTERGGGGGEGGVSGGEEAIWIGTSSWCPGGASLIFLCGVSFFRFASVSLGLAAVLLVGGRAGSLKGDDADCPGTLRG